MFCRYCGNDIAGDSVFCEVCGKKLKDEQVNQAPVMQEPTQYDTNSPLYYYNAQADTKPLDQGIKREYHASKYEKMSGFSGSLPPIDSTSAPKIEYKRAPDEPIKPKKEKGNGKLPYVLLPVGVVTSILVGVGISLLGSNITTGLINNYMMQSENPLLISYLSTFLSNASGILPTLIILVLFSFCCKGFNQKSRFIGSYYASTVGGILSTILTVIIGYIILYSLGFYNSESMSIYSIVTFVCSGLSIIVIYPLLALMWFSLSEKYTVKKGEKVKLSKIILPCVFLGIYGLMCLAIKYINTLIYENLYGLFGEYSHTFAFNVSSLITTSISLICLFLLALACKGGYRKLAFVGSFYFSKTILGAVSSAVAVPFAISGRLSIIGVGNVIGDCLQYALIIGLSIIIYILLNRYTVEKINKKA